MSPSPSTPDRWAASGRRPIVLGDRSRSWLIAACAALAACAPLRPPSTAPAVPQPIARSPGTLTYEQRLEEAARIEDRQGRWGDEAVTLELLAILRPDDASLTARRQALNDRIGVAIQDHLRRGAEANKRGQYEAAANQFLAALALSPNDPTAAEALRAIEKEKNRRLLLVKQRRAVQAADQGD